jgi:DNA-binding response OmpR family regulator
MAGVLIVEDEAIIGMAIAADLTDLGYEPFGPYSRIESAVDSIARNKIDAAIVDINLRGAQSHAIALELRRRKIPFVFLTGYAAASIDERFRDVPVFRKPLDPDQFIEMMRMLLGS